jgi:hypothetical protein
MIRREWAMPNADTFDVPVIGAFVKRYLHSAKVSVDPFSRNKRWATYTNDLNPETQAEFHMDATDFLCHLIRQGVKADLVILDPPYSPRQVKECYDGIGHKMEQNDALLGLQRKKMKQEIRELLTPEGIVLTFGWNSVGMGKGFEIADLLLVCHGSDHNDTICLAERRIQPGLAFGDEA